MATPTPGSESQEASEARILKAIDENKKQLRPVLDEIPNLTEVKLDPEFLVEESKERWKEFECPICTEIVN